MLGPVARISNQVGRNVMKSFVRNGSGGGIPGQNLPFDVFSRTRLTLNLFWYVGTSMAAPFLIVELQLRKNAVLAAVSLCVAIRNRDSQFVMR